MKKMLMLILSAVVLFPLYSQEEAETVTTEEVVTVITVVPIVEAAANGLGGNGSFSVGGGVSTGLHVRHRDFGGMLGTVATNPETRYPMTLFLGSHSHNTRIGEAWLNFGYSWRHEIGSFGLQIGFWAHGDAATGRDTVHLGDRFVWANLINDRLRFIGGQGGGTPISSGGWINADWLSYAGLRFFWVDPSGFSAGIKFPDPGEEGIRPVNYFSMLGFGAAFNQDNWWVSLQFSNNPIYDDSEANFFGGLRRPQEQDPIGQAGNIAVGFGLPNLFGGRGSAAIEALVTNLGEEQIEGLGNGYMFSPVGGAFALTTGFQVTNQFFVELKARYNFRRGDNYDLTEAIHWGKVEFEPFFRFQPFSHLSFNLALYGAFFINNYYLALDVPNVAMRSWSAGQNPRYGELLGYLSRNILRVTPGVTLSLGGMAIDAGYEGTFSRDHVRNTIFIDFRWTF